MKMKAKNATAVLFALMLTSSAIAAPTLSTPIVTATDDGTLDVVYSISGDAAIVTCDILTNGVSVAPGGFEFLSGDIHKALAEGSHSFSWQMRRAIPEADYGSLNVEMALTAWATNAPPDYMLVSMEGRNLVGYYADPDHFPFGGLTNEIYRTSLMPMRFIKAKGVEWTMGSPAAEPCRRENENEHLVTLPDDYYICLFEFTYGYLRGMSGPPDSVRESPSGWAEGDVGRANMDMVPVYNVNLGNVRGVAYPSEPTMGSTSSSIGSGGNTYIGAIRNATDIPFDLPTEGQWEYAARGGCGQGYFGVSNLPISGAKEQMDVALKPYAWINANANRNNTGAEGYPKWNEWRAFYPGKFKPNDYGIYDMLGNRWEYCLDYYTETLTAENAGSGFYSGDGNNKLVVKGGNLREGTDLARPAFRTNGVSNVGFRLVCPVKPYGL